MRFSLTEQLIHDVHPKYPEIIVTLRKLSELEKMEHFAEIGKNTVPVAVTRADTNALVLDKKGNVVVHEQQNIPVNTFIDLFEKGIKSWTGFEDENGKAIPFDKKHIPLLFSSKLAFDKPHPKAGEKYEVDGVEKTYPDTINTPYWSHLVDLLLDDEVFEDPSKATSESQ